MSIIRIDLPVTEEKIRSLKVGQLYNNSTFLYTETPLDAAEGRYARVVLDHRATPTVMEYVNGAELARYSQQGPVTPDHVIRTKPLPLWAADLAYDDPKKLALQLATAVAEYTEQYEAYVAKYRASVPDLEETSDPMPRVLLLPGLGALINSDSFLAAVSLALARSCRPIGSGLAAGMAVPGLPVPIYALLLCFTLGIMGIITPYATGPSPVYFGSDYVSRKHFWILGTVFGAIFLLALLVIGTPWLFVINP